MIMTKKFLATSALIAMSIASTAQAETIGFSVPSLASSFWVSALYGGQRAAKEAGAELIVVDAGGDANAVQQISQIQDLIQRRVDAIVIGATNGESIAPVVEQALAAGIKVVGLSSPPANEGLTAIVSADHYEMGKLQAECMGKALKGKGEVAMMAGPQGQGWSDRRAAGFKETISTLFPDMKVIAESHQADNRNDALRVAEDWTQRFPDVNGVYSATDDMAAGVINAFDASGVKKVVFTASNLSPTAKDLIKSGKLSCTSIQKIVAQGAAAIKVAIKASQGVAIEKSIVTPGLLIDASNVDTVDLGDVVAPEGYRP